MTKMKDLWFHSLAGRHYTDKSHAARWSQGVGAQVHSLRGNVFSAETWKRRRSQPGQVCGSHVYQGCSVLRKGKPGKGQGGKGDRAGQTSYRPG